jgi:hypothetical protein
MLVPEFTRNAPLLQCVRVCMQLKIVLRAGLPVLVCAVAFCANEVWNNKVSSRWTEADAKLILTNSPWAKQVKTKTAQSGMGRRAGVSRGGGMGGRRYPTGGRGGRGGENASMSALVRWESARPVQEAEARLQNLHAAGGPSDAKEAPNPDEKHYVVSVIGLRPPGRQSGDDGGSRQIRDQLLTTTQLVRKNKTPIGPDDVKVKTQDGANEIQFFFPKTNPISQDDKEVTFHTVIGRMTVENKFQLKSMTRNKRLEL